MSVQSMLNPRRDSALNQVAAAATRHGSWPVTIGLVAFAAAAIALAIPLVSDNGWFFPAVIVAAATLVGCQLLRQLTGSASAAAVGGFVTLIAAVTVVAAPAQLTDAVTVLGVRLAEVSQQLASDQPPLRESPAVTTVFALSGGALMLIADICIFAWRRVLLASLTALPMAVVPTLVGLPSADFWIWACFAAALVLLLYLGNRYLQRGEDEARTSLGFTADGRRLGGLSSALAAGGVAIATVSLLAPMLPPSSGALWNTIGGGQILSTTRVNPIIDLGDDLRRGAPADVLRYATSMPQGTLPYISLTSLTQLGAGTEWQPTEFKGAPINGSGTLPQPETLNPGPNVQTVNYHFVMDAGVSPYLPKVGVPTAVAGVTGDYARDERTGDIRERRDEPISQSFQAESVLPQPTAEEIAAAPAEVPEQLRGYLELPQSPAIDQIRAVMQEVVDVNATPFQQAQQLQQWLSGGAFTYSEQAPVSGGYDGTSLDVVTAFLEYRSGYCVHFASAMAVMGRILKIPTRIQVGFTPGTPQSVNELGQTVYSVTTDDLHAWAEFWVPGYGWVPMESTPSSALNQQEIAPAPNVEPTQTVAEPTQTPTPTSTPTPAPSEGSEPTEAGASPTPTAAPKDADTSEVTSQVGQLVGVIAVAVAVLAASALMVNGPALVRGATRRSRRSVVHRADSSQQAAAAAWHEVIDSARDLGTAVSRTATTGAQTRTLVSAFNWDAHGREHEAAERLGAAYDAAWFSDPNEPASHAVEWEDVETLRTAMVAGTSPAARRRARWLPASLRDRMGRKHAGRSAARHAALPAETADIPPGDSQ